MKLLQAERARAEVELKTQMDGMADALAGKVLAGG
jgi:hypothetical protein